MLNFTKTVSCLEIRTAQKIDTKLMHPFEKFRQILMVKFYSMKDFYFLTQEMKERKILVWGLLWCKTLEVSKLAMCDHQKMSMFSDKKMLGSDT